MSKTFRFKGPIFQGLNVLIVVCPFCNYKHITIWRPEVHKTKISDEELLRQAEEYRNTGQKPIDVKYEDEGKENEDQDQIDCVGITNGLGNGGV